MPMWTKLIAALAFSTTHGFSIHPRRHRRTTAVGLSAKVKVVKAPEEWKSLLDDESFRVLREAGTERPFTSLLNDVKSSDVGTFVCKGCGARLFPAASKYESGTGWPSFSHPVANNDDAIEYRVDFAAILPRIECRCSSCGGHLGHVFEDGPQPTGLRYCVNGASMEFAQDEEASSPTDAAVDVKLPLQAVLPGVALNLGVAGLFLASFVNHGMVVVPSAGIFAQASAAFPLSVAAYYGYHAMVGLSRTKPWGLRRR